MAAIAFALYKYCVCTFIRVVLLGGRESYSFEYRGTVCFIVVSVYIYDTSNNSIIYMFIQKQWELFCFKLYSHK